MSPRCKSSLVLSSTWHAWKRMVFTDVLKIQSSIECPVEASAGSSDVPFAQSSFSIYPQVEQLPKGDFHCWLPSLLFLANPVIYSSPVNICGWGRNLERDFWWVVAKIIDKKWTLLAGLTSNNLNWLPRGERGIPGQCISETPVGPITLDMVCLFWASSYETGPWAGITPGTVSQGKQHTGQLSTSSPPGLQPLTNCWGLNRSYREDHS